MVEHTEHDRNLAARILNRLFGSTKERFVPSIGKEFEEIPYGFSIWDVQHDINFFTNELSALEELNEHTKYEVQFPALTFKSELTLPVSLSFLGFPWPLSFPNVYSRRQSFWHHVLFDLLYDLGDSWSEHLIHDLGLTSLSLEQARESFFHNATKFLANRIAAVRNLNLDEHNPPELARSPNLPPKIGTPPAPVIGCTFIVTTNTSSLRVFWSGAYYVKPNFFAAPTTPASGVLQTGTYVFGVDGGPYGSAIHWDQNAVCSLPGVPMVHLNF